MKELTNKEKIIKLISGINNGQSMQNIFFDWVTIMAMCILNQLDMKHGKTWQQREDTYKNIVKRYTNEELNVFGKAMLYLDEELSNDPYDILGEIYHKLDAQNKRTGQFFTPFHISLMMAQLQEFKDEETIMNERSCGAGGMILAVAKVMQERGINYRKNLKVIAQDVDWNCVYMTYVQLSLAGIKAIVYQGNSLTAEKHSEIQTLYTPAQSWHFYI
ncbi:MAG: N-6 DNA methylase [Acetivibrio ethanolgignens]